MYATSVSQNSSTNVSALKAGTDSSVGPVSLALKELLDWHDKCQAEGEAK